MMQYCFLAGKKEVFALKNRFLERRGISSGLATLWRKPWSPQAYEDCCPPSSSFFATSLNQAIAKLKIPVLDEGTISLSFSLLWKLPLPSLFPSSSLLSRCNYDDWTRGELVAWLATRISFQINHFFFPSVFALNFFFLSTVIIRIFLPLGSWLDDFNSTYLDCRAKIKYRFV